MRLRVHSRVYIRCSTRVLNVLVLVHSGRYSGTPSVVYTPLGYLGTKSTWLVYSGRYPGIPEYILYLGTRLLVLYTRVGSGVTYIPYLGIRVPNLLVCYSRYPGIPRVYIYIPYLGTQVSYLLVLVYSGRCPGVPRVYTRVPGYQTYLFWYTRAGTGVIPADYIPYVRYLAAST